MILLKFGPEILRELENKIQISSHITSQGSVEMDRQRREEDEANRRGRERGWIKIEANGFEHHQPKFVATSLHCWCTINEGGLLTTIVVNGLFSSTDSFISGTFYLSCLGFRSRMISFHQCFLLLHPINYIV